jgi:hypothetical protein
MEKGWKKDIWSVEKLCPLSQPYCIQYTMFVWELPVMVRRNVFTNSMYSLIMVISPYFLKCQGITFSLLCLMGSICVFHLKVIITNEGGPWSLVVIFPFSPMFYLGTEMAYYRPSTGSYFISNFHIDGNFIWLDLCYTFALPICRKGKLEGGEGGRLTTYNLPPIQSLPSLDGCYILEVDHKMFSNAI